MEICERNRCTGCGSCVNICPRDCVDLKENEEGFLFPVIDQTRCIQCHKCKEVCPSNTPIINLNSRPKAAIGCQILDQKKLKRSSSGGVFVSLAEYVIKNNGIVFGCTMNSDLEICHKSIETVEDIKTLQGSKYLQSNTKYTYREVLDNLERNRLVLYVGCPCQIAGLYVFLENKKFDNLLTVDLVCHGVGSKKIFNIEIDSLEQKYKSKIVKYEFRCKEKRAYSNYMCKIVFENNRIIFIKGLDGKYMRCFLRYAIYRESCYKCPFATIPRVGDITIGDFVGLDENIVPKKIKEKGFSVLLLNNQKAKCAFSLIQNQMMVVPRPLDEATSTNKNLIQPSIRPEKRNKLKDTTQITDKLFQECRFTLKNRVGIVILSHYNKITNRINRKEK